MKNLRFLFIILTLSLSATVKSQIRIGGGVDINVSLPIPVPKVVIIKEERRTYPKPRRVEYPNHRENRCEPKVCGNLGTIINQNGPNGRIDLVIIDATFENIDRTLQRVTYHTNTRETIEIVIARTNPNDYNYHFANNNCRCDGNSIVSVAFNGSEMPLRDASLSLQPGHSFHSVLNIHSVYDGNYNGTVNF